MSKSKILNKKRGCVVVISAPSGCGKTTVVKRLLSKRRSARVYSISVTTRQPRGGEKDGKDYFFYSEKKFVAAIEKNKFLEWAKVFNYYYGTPAQYVFDCVNEGKDVILDIDVRGAQQLMKTVPDGIFIFILPPSLSELKKRLQGRGTDSVQVVEKRFSEAKRELKAALKYGYVVTNKTVDETVRQIEMIIETETYRVTRNKEAIHGLYST